MEMNAIKAVYFVGIGGIGMSAIARYFLQKGLCVGGYDRTPSELTRKLQEEGARIHYEEDVEQIPSACRDKDTCLVVYTPCRAGLFQGERIRDRETCAGVGHVDACP